MNHLSSLKKIPMARKLHIDIETFSSVDIRSSGVYKYTESIDFEILIVAYAFNQEPVQIIDLARGDKLSQVFIDGMKDPLVEKHAHNATFERRAFIQYGFDIPIGQWRCSAVKAAQCGLPLSLDLVSKALSLGDKGKMSTGKALIRFFSIPCKPTKTNGFRERNFPGHDLKKWGEFKRYCARDVEAEREIDLQLLKYEPPQFERINYIIDQQINDRGILIDLAMVKSALKMDNRFRKEVIQRLKDTTGIENPNSASQMKEWLSNALGKIIKTLAKDSVIELLDKSEDAAVSDALKGRMKLAKTSTKKYASMMDCVCDDGRAHGLFQFYGANRTGRWAGRLIQLQNLPRNHMKDIESARGVVASGDYDLAKMLYESIPNVLSELIRTAFVAAKGKTFVVADFSAIEARVLSWVAQEKWRMDVFEKHGKIYEASAAMMFGVPIETVTKGSDLRQRGKIAELALGYQGSVGAMGKLDVKMPPDERQELVYKWRKANPRIVKLWQEVQENAIIAIKTQREVQSQFLNYDCDGTVFTIQLPSGRKLFYQKPRIVINKFGGEAMEFMGIDQAIKKWKAIDTYGGKLVENIVQAISRDLLAYSMQRLDAEGFDMVMHVHDEIICESPEHDSKDDLQMMCNIMGEAVPWAKGLPLVADGYVTKFYKKQ